MRFMLISPRLLLPLIVLTGFLIVGIRIDDIWTAAEDGHLFARSALAEAKTAEAKQDPKPQVQPQPQPAAPAKPVAEVDGVVTPSIAPPKPDEEITPSEMEVLKQLSARREMLDRRGRDLDTREALIKVAEQRVDQKIKEMETLRQQLQGMVNQASEAQTQQLENLVKIYETMKPDDAAKIFETLDMPTLLGVVQRMKPKSTAPIMAKMVPEKAKELTVALTKQDQLPQIK